MEVLAGKNCSNCSLRYECDFFHPEGLCDHFDPMYPVIKGVEISLMMDDDKVEHEGYYSNIDEAIATLIDIKTKYIVEETE